MESGAVVTEHNQASSIGKSILAAGGNAVDALIAAVLAVNTLCPHDSDLGGGGFAVLRTAEGDHLSIDFRDAAPASLCPETLGIESTKWGPYAVAAPGEVRALQEIHGRFGCLPWRQLVQPSVLLAENGMNMYEELYGYLVREVQPASDGSVRGTWIDSEPAFLKTFTQAGKLIPVGSKWYRPNYLLLGRHREEHKYRVRWTPCLKTIYRDHAVWTTVAPSSGGPLLAALSTLEQMEPQCPGSTLDLHYMSEALRFSFGIRTAIGDPFFVPCLSKEEQESWSGPENARRRVQNICKDSTLPPEHYNHARVEISQDHGTSSMTAFDSSGLAISITTTIGRKFGSRIMTSSGIVLNDAVDDFSIPGRTKRAVSVGYASSPANYLSGGKRPLSSMCPYIVEDASGTPILAGGSAGGNPILSTNAQIIHNVVEHGMSAAEAVRAPRIHDQVLPDVLLLERGLKGESRIPGFSDQVAAELAEKGHVIEWIDKSVSTPSAIGRTNKVWSCGSEPRKPSARGAVWKKIDP